MLEQWMAKEELARFVRKGRSRSILRDLTPEKKRHMLRYLDGHALRQLGDGEGEEESRTRHFHFFRFHPSPSSLSPPSPWPRLSTMVDANDQQGSAQNGQALTQGPIRDFQMGHHVRAQERSKGGKRESTHDLKSSEKGSSFKKIHGYLYLRLNLSSI
jgi:hypothetical protein